MIDSGDGEGSVMGDGFEIHQCFISSMYLAY